MIYYRYIYFIQAKVSGRIKIGISSRPSERLARLQKDEDEPLRILTCVPGNWDSEYWAHKCFASQRLHGEWFATSDELAALIEQARALGRDDVAGEIFLTWVRDGAIKAFRRKQRARHVSYTLSHAMSGTSV